MRIAIDYGNTYSADPVLFAAFISQAKARGHEVVCVTMRGPSEPCSVPCETIYTDGEKKERFMDRLGRHVDIWIDDLPGTIR